MCLLSPSPERVLSSLRPVCASGVNVVFRSLLPRLQALDTFLQAQSVDLTDEEGEIIEYLEVLSCRRHQETIFKALVQQLKQLSGFNAFQEDSSEDEDNNMLQMLLEAPRKSREAHWMHLQIDALMAQQETEEESHDWQKHWQEDYKQQIQVFEEFLSSEKLQEHLQILETSEKLEVLTALQYERRKFSENDEKELMPLEEQKLLDRAIEEVSGAVEVEIVPVSDWFVPSITSACVVVGADRKAKIKPSSCEDLHAEPSKESDVYAFASIIQEATSPLTLEDSDNSLSSIEEDQEQPSGMWSLIDEMTSSDPNDRPDMDSVVRILLNLTERERLWSDAQFPELLLHAPDVWTALRTASQSHETGVQMCARVLHVWNKCCESLIFDETSSRSADEWEFQWEYDCGDLVASFHGYLDGLEHSDSLSIWSELVHPHVVELFGACHVGSTPFFVFERGRGGSLMAYLSRYQNLPFSTILSQKLHICGDYCTSWVGTSVPPRTRDCARQLRSDNIVVVVEKRSALAKRNRRAPERRGHGMVPVPPSLASDIYSFGMIIIEALLHGATGSCEELQDGLQDEGQSFFEHKPDQFEHDAWELVQKMFTYVMVHVPGEAQPVTISQALATLKSQIQKPTEDGIDIEASSGNDLNAQILLRLEDIYERLCDVEANIDDDSDLSTIVANFVDILTQFIVHVDVSGTGNSLTQIAAIRQRTSDKFSFHKDLDELLDGLLARDSLPSQVHDWKRQWYLNKARQTLSYAWTLMDPDAADILLNELKDAHDREEILAFLRFEVTRHRSSYTPHRWKPWAQRVLIFPVGCPIPVQFQKLPNISTCGDRRNGLSHLTKSNLTHASL
ncbi:Protein kinase-like domain [Phytophthora cactorum]|nr:Protein kinase-like domain [Phytophthora cactorum]